MKIVASLRRFQRPGTNDWAGRGTIAAVDPVVAPARCYADADGAAAAAHGNPDELSTLPFGDHPFGLYHAVAVIWSKTEAEFQTYGPVRILLDPIAGDALEAKKNGRTGLCIHGGPTRAGELRATHGCLRVDDATARALALAIEPELALHHHVEYLCEQVA